MTIHQGPCFTLTQPKKHAPEASEQKRRDTDDEREATDEATKVGQLLLQVRLLVLLIVHQRVDLAEV
jgi:hypothetical protein